MPEQTKNFAVSLVATAPSPATSGTSLVVTAAEGGRFPTPPFNVVICPADAQPTPANAEIVRVTAISTDTLTITRTQESSSARTVVVGDRIAAMPTAKTLSDLEAGDLYASSGGVLAVRRMHVPVMALTRTTTQTISTGGFGTDADFDSTAENSDPGSAGVFTADLTNNWIKVNVACYVLVNAIWVWASNATGNRELYMNRDNSSAVNQESHQQFFSAAVSGYHVMTMPMLCAVNDRLKLSVRQTSGGNLATNGTGLNNVRLRAILMSL